MAKKGTDNVRLEFTFDKFKQLLLYAAEHENEAPEMKMWSAMLKDKLNRMEQNENYSIYKDKTKTPEEREAARQHYLDSKGIPPEFRW